ncbi:MAG: VOC family protein [Cryobacterium sp.]|jgi:catechol 2,3-dioxygenase-like lactoylglutathione lyase family enzyme|nr:VOC family protein [Cryobacterium sp.]
MTTDVQITFDCADPAKLAEFWAEALGYEPHPPPDGFDTWDAALESFGVPPEQWNSRSAILPRDGVHPRIFFQRVPEGKTVKNRVHLDVRVAPGLEGDERMAALEVEARRLEALGATRAYRIEPDASAMENGFITMRDPEGNEFCLD